MILSNFLQFYLCELNLWTLCTWPFCWSWLNWKKGKLPKALIAEYCMEEAGKAMFSVRFIETWDELGGPRLERSLSDGTSPRYLKTLES